MYLKSLTCMEAGILDAETTHSFKLLLLFIHQIMSNFLWSHGLQHARLPIPHHLLEFAQVHVRWIHDVIQPYYLLSPSSPPAFNLS